jgi:hypothetical protein
MSAVPPIAPEFVHCSDSTKSATSGHSPISADGTGGGIGCRHIRERNKQERWVGRAKRNPPTQLGRIMMGFAALNPPYACRLSSDRPKSGPCQIVPILYATLQHMTRECRSSVSHFSRAFRCTMGVAPHHCSWRVASRWWPRKSSAINNCRCRMYRWPAASPIIVTRSGSRSA